MFEQLWNLRPSLNTLFDWLLEPSSELTFSHSPLEPGEIRILNVLPGRLEDDIRFSMEHSSLRNAQNRFIALSYTWGTPDPPCMLVHDETGYELRITPNCEQAIRRLRSGEHSVRLWVDAVCINQADPRERQAQVSRMGDIYRAASYVAAYIGEEADNSAQAIAFLTDSKSWNDWIPPALETALRNLLCRPWFGRIWVIQEVFNAQSVELICGPHRTSWWNMRRYRQWHRSGQRDIYRWPLVMSIKDFRTYLACDLLKLLTQARKCGATDGRDKVYALLPMFRDAADWELVPDYTISREEVFLKLATFLIDQGVDFLCAVSHPKGTLPSQGLPTWVPEWDVEEGCVSLWPNTGRAMAETLNSRTRLLQDPYCIHETQFYESGKSRAAQINTLPPYSNSLAYFLPLHVAGVYVGRIQALSVKMHFSIQRRVDFRRAWNEFRRLHSVRKFRDNCSGYAGHPLHQSIDAALEHGMWFPAVDRPQSPGSIKMHKRRDDNGTYATWREEVVGAINQRAMMVTSDGEMGLAPEEACIGDHICIFSGAPVPSILRPVEGETECFFLVGSCYLNGMMSKNAIKKLEVQALKRGKPASYYDRDFFLL